MSNSHDRISEGAYIIDPSGENPPKLFQPSSINEEKSVVLPDVPSEIYQQVYESKLVQCTLSMAEQCGIIEPQWWKK